MDFLKALWSQVAGIFAGASVGARIALVLGLLAAVGGVATVVVWAGRPDYRLLFARLEPDEASEVVAALEDQKIPWKLEAGGTSILVPSQHVYKTRMDLAAKGLPRGQGMGFEIFDKSAFGMTDFLQDVNYTRALQGELARTIARIDAIEGATVHIARPKPSVFTERDRVATSSVVVRLRPGSSLTERQVAGIAHLVAGSVEGLKPENVSVLDGRGFVLNPQGAGDLAVAGDQLSMRKDLERYLTEKAQKLLEKVYGPDRVALTVSARLDFETRETSSEKFDPDSQVARMERIESVQNKSSEPSSGAPSSVASGAAAPGSAAPGTSSDTTEVTETNYEINRTSEKILRGGAKLEKLTVSLLVDESLAAAVAKLEGIVKTAVGFDEARGDTIESTTAPFSSTTISGQDDGISPLDRVDLIVTSVEYATIALVTLVLAFFLRSFLRRAGRAPKPEEAAAGAEEAEEGAPAAAQAAAAAARAEAVGPAFGAGAPVQAGAALREEIARTIQVNPSAASRLAARWMAEEASA